MRFVARVLSVALLASVVFTFSDASAQARPRNCTARAVGNESFAVCASGTGIYQAATQCDAPWWRLDYVAYGPAVQSPGYYSWATCRGDDRAYNPVVIIHP